MTRDIDVACDPEVFFTKDSKPYPVTGLIGGTKDSPRKVEGGAVLEDNIMGEFHIQPAITATSFAQRCETQLAYLKTVAEKHGCTLSLQSYADFEPKYLATPAAMELGCEPDYDAYTLARNPPYDVQQFGNRRYAGGHIHIGIPGVNAHPDTRTEVVKWLDLVVGIPMMLKEGETPRSTTYGLPGRFRPKEYGLEYRTPSNSWLLSRERMIWIFRCVVKAVTGGTERRGLPVRGGEVRRMLANPSDARSRKDAQSYFDYAHLKGYPNA